MKKHLEIRNPVSRSLELKIQRNYPICYCFCFCFTVETQVHMAFEFENREVFWQRPHCPLVNSVNICCYYFSFSRLYEWNWTYIKNRYIFNIIECEFISVNAHLIVIICVLLEFDTEIMVAPPNGCQFLAHRIRGIAIWPYENKCLQIIAGSVAVLFRWFDIAN